VPAFRAAARAHVDEVVGGGEQVQVMVNDDDGGPGVQQPVEHADHRDRAPQWHVHVDITQVVVPGPAHADGRGQGSRHGNLTSRHTRQLKPRRRWPSP
jgi:hypothetical protein